MEACIKEALGLGAPDDWSLCEDTCVCLNTDPEEIECPSKAYVYTYCLVSSL